MCEISRRLHCRLVIVKGGRVYLDELGINVDDTVMDYEDEVECGIACSTEQNQNV